MKYKHYERNPENNIYFRIHEEPNDNLSCEPFPRRSRFIAHFVDNNNNERFKYLMGTQKKVLRAKIEMIHTRIMANSSISDNLQTILEYNPNRDDLTRRYEHYIHLVKEDISSIRKLESFYLYYNSLYVRKPEYAGEERDNVNTY